MIKMLEHSTPITQSVLIFLLQITYTIVIYNVLYKFVPPPQYPIFIISIITIATIFASISSMLITTLIKHNEEKNIIPT